MDNNTKKDVKDISITYSIKDCKVLSYSSVYYQPIAEKNFIHDFTFQITTTHSIIPEKKFIQLITEVKIYFDPEKVTQLGDISTVNIFEIKNFDEVVKKDDKGIYLPLQLMAMFVGLSISNTRGMLVAKAAGTCLQNAIIPVLNPTELLKKSIKDKQILESPTLVSDSPE